MKHDQRVEMTENKHFVFIQCNDNGNVLQRDKRKEGREDSCNRSARSDADSEPEIEKPKKKKDPKKPARAKKKTVS